MGDGDRAAKLAASRLERPVAPTLLVLARSQGAGGQPAVAGRQLLLSLWERQLPGECGRSGALAFRRSDPAVDLWNLPPDIRDRSGADGGARALGCTDLRVAFRHG